MIEISILGIVVGVQWEMNGTVELLSCLKNVGGGKSLYTWRGDLC